MARDALIDWARKEQARLAEGVMRAAPEAPAAFARGQWTMLNDVLTKIEAIQEADNRDDR